MTSFRDALRSGHPPTLFAAFLYFDFSFAVWVLNGAMGPFITDTFKLSPSETGFMISVPILAGAVMRFPLGVLAQFIGRRNAAVTEMTLIVGAMAYGYFLVDTFAGVLAMGVLLGIAGASFGVALSLGSGWYPPKYKGLAMGIAGAGNSGTVLAVLFAPPLAEAFGWRTVYGFAGLTMAIPLIVMLVFAKEPPDREHKRLKEHVSCLVELDGWVFSMVYVITFGGFVGLSNFLPTFFHEQFGVTAVEAGRLTMLAALLGSAVRVLGGHLSDRFGGISVLMLMLRATGVGMILLAASTSLVWTTILFMLCFAAFGIGNGALFQLVPLRWPSNTAVAGSMIGEIGALGGAIMPAVLGLSKEYAGSFAVGFLFYVFVTSLVAVGLEARQKRWVGKWIGPRGKVLEPSGRALDALGHPAFTRKA
jgi:NNP family nitrate/nitrite transporter-like MFS transporter